MVKIKLNANNRRQSIILMALYRYGVQPIIETNNTSIFEINNNILKKILTFMIK